MLQISYSKRFANTNDYQLISKAFNLLSSYIEEE